MAEKIISVDELDCADCAYKLEDNFKKFDGIINTKANFATAELKIIYDPKIHNEKSLMGLLKKLGFSASYRQKNLSKSGAWWKRKTILFRAISGSITATALTLHFFGASASVYIPVYVAAIIIGLYYPAINGFKSLLKLTLNLNSLLIIATLGAVSLGLWAEAGGLIFVFSLGEILEAYAINKTRSSIQKLIALSPKEALVKKDGKEIKLAVEKVVVGDVLIIKPGEKVPLDGIIADGYSSINQAAITGESMPVNKKQGDNVFAGTINLQGSLEVKVNKLSKDTTLAKIIHSVEEAQLEKAPSQKFSEVFGRYYTPVIFVLAILVAFIAPVIFGQPFRPWFTRALVLLVVSCPCALILSTPVAIVTSIGTAAKNGVLIKGGMFVEELAKTKVFVFDKTGTLTKGQPEVTDIIPFGLNTEKGLLEMAIAVEARSEHPLAEAILRKGKSDNLTVEQAESFEAITGKGARAKLNGKEIIVGSSYIFTEKTPDDKSKLITKLQEQGKTIVYVGNGKEIYGAIAIADQLRTSSAETIAKIRGFGAKKVIMLTGDNKITASFMAKKLGINDFKAELLPEEKVKAIKQLKDRYGKVAMIGDGVNDAPALALSTVGIAMGVAGTDIALETADLALMSDDLSKIAYAVLKSKKALRIIKQNTFFSLSLIAILVTSALLGHLDLVPGIFINELSSLVIVANGLRLLRN